MSLGEVGLTLGARRMMDFVVASLMIATVSENPVCFGYAGSVLGWVDLKKMDAHKMWKDLLTNSFLI